MRRYQKYILATLAGIFTIGIVSALIFSGNDLSDSNTNPRRRAFMFYMHSYENRKAIQKYAQEHNSLSGASSVVKLENSEFGAEVVNFVSADGVLVTIDKQYHISVLLEPKMESGRVNWYCNVTPKNIAPVFCSGGSNVLPNKALKVAP